MTFFELFGAEYDPLPETFQKEIENEGFFDYSISREFIQTRRDLIRG
jgi:hypothetical protein